MPIFPATDSHIQAAAARLQRGELVAFPTETVYGLGADARDADAVAQIYQTKGRPAFNPLIVHVEGADGARAIARWDERAQNLADALWPGPLTLVLPSRGVVCEAVSAGLPTVAVRAPAHSVAQQLLSASGLPLAAPSANASQGVSPTRAAHVAASLGDEVWVLDGGPCEIGLESTVLDLTSAPPRVLRPGTIGARELRALIGEVQVSDEMPDDETPRKAPGQMARHYAPRATVRLFSHLTDAHFHAVALGDGKKLGVLALEPTALKAREIVMPAQPAPYARALYAALHEMDESGVEMILIEEVPATPAWDAVRDRLRRAATV